MKRFWILDFGFSIPRSEANKVFGLALCALLFALCGSAEAQQSTKVLRIGFLTTGPARNPAIEALRQGLRELGYVEGKNILIESGIVKGDLSRFRSWLRN